MLSDKYVLNRLKNLCEEFLVRTSIYNRLKTFH